MQLRAEQYGYPILVRTQWAGEDLEVLITGGVRPHIGSVSVAYPAQGAVVTEEVTLPGHKDSVVGTRYARCLAQALHRTVSVSCGIHYESPDAQQLSAIVACTEELLQQLLRALGSG